MKKSLLLLFIAVLLFFCTACGNAEQSQSDQQNPTQSDTTPMTGEVENNTYTNDYLGLSFTAPDSFTFFGKDALASLVGADPELSVKEIADTNGAAYALMAVDHTKEASVTLVYENLNVTTGSTLSAQEYADSIIKQGLNQTDNSILQEETEIKLGEHTYYKIRILINDPNKPLFKTHYLRLVDNYMVQITTSVPTGFTTSFDFDSMFK